MARFIRPLPGAITLATGALAAAIIVAGCGAAPAPLSSSLTSSASNPAAYGNAALSSLSGTTQSSSSSGEGAGTTTQSSGQSGASSQLGELQNFLAQNPSSYADYFQNASSQLGCASAGATGPWYYQPQTNRWTENLYSLCDTIVGYIVGAQDEAGNDPNFRAVVLLHSAGNGVFQGEVEQWWQGEGVCPQPFQATYTLQGDGTIYVQLQGGIPNNCGIPSNYYLDYYLVR